jgi:hypothetical protein
LTGVVRDAGVELQNRGGRWVGLCPFHSEKTPSFHVYQDRHGKWRFYCFGCGIHGDAADFVQRFHGLDFKGALNHLGINQGPLTMTDRRKISEANKKRSQQRKLFALFREWERAAIQMKAVSELSRRGYGDTPDLPQQNQANTPRLDEGREETTDDFGAVEPLDIFGDTILTGKPEWPNGACPAPIINFARDEAERIGVDVEMIAFPAITCAAIAISDKFKIQPKQHDTRWMEAARL